MSKSLLVGVIMGSDSDLRVMREASNVLDELDVGYEVDIVSAHRTPKKLMEYSETAESRGLGVIIAGAGGAAHLPGMVAASTCLPVIGVPVNATALDGMDALLSVAQMPAGVPVATVAIDGARNAGILAAQILALVDSDLAKRLKNQKSELRKSVEEKSARSRFSSGAKG